FRIHRHRELPLRRSRTISIALVSPGFRAGIGGLLRYGSELPHLRAGARVEGTGTTGIAVRTDDEKVPINDGRGLVRHDHIDFAFFAECRYGFAGIPIECDQSCAGSKEDPRRHRSITRPECDTSPRRLAGLEFKAPDFFSGLRLQGYDAIVRRDVHH